jgi:hypothetical protein
LSQYSAACRRGLDARQSSAHVGAHAGAMLWTHSLIDAGMVFSLIGVIGFGVYIFMAYLIR